MGFSRHYFNEHNFMLTKVCGEIDDDDLMSHVNALNRETQGCVNVRELSDCRELVKTKLTTLGTTLNASNEEKKPGSRIVILVPKDDGVAFAMARAYQMFCATRRQEVKVSTEYEEALNWLANDDPKEAEILDELVKSV